MSITEVHEEKNTFSVDVNIPGHEPRVATALFEHSKKALIARDGDRCFICGQTAQESGHPLESHHHPIERSLANMIDWQRFSEDCKAGDWGPHAKAFDWDKFFDGAAIETVTIPADGDEPAYAAAFLIPGDPMLFVDDQTVNGLILCKAHHTGKDEGIHDLPYPIWITQKYAKEGYQFSPIEVIHHEQVA